VLEIASRILFLMGRDDLKPVILGENRGEIRDQWLSSHKARTQLKWVPRFSLDDGVRQTIAWYVDFLSSDRQSVPGNRVQSAAG
jgi:CDP-glucose 4,6-dehydratase